MNRDDPPGRAAPQRGFAQWRSPGVLGMTLLAVAFSTLAAWIVWDGLVERYHDRRVGYFAAEAGEIIAQVDERFRSYRQVLRGVRGLFTASRSLDRAQWENYVDWLRLDEGYPGMRALGYAMRVPADELDRHVSHMRAEGFDDYRVWPAPVREPIVPIVLVAPFDWRNRQALGFDLFTDPVRREAMEEALWTGRAATTARLDLVTETGNDAQAGVQIYLPIFARGGAAAAEAGRQETLAAWVFASLHIEDFVKGALEPYSGELRVRIYDQVESPEALLYDTHPEGGAPAADPELTLTHRLALGGREWLLRMEALPGLSRGFDVRQAELAAIAGVGLLFVIVTWSFSVTRGRAHALARASESLRRSEARYGTLVNLAHEGIAATDETLALTFVNPRLAEMLGYDGKELIERPLEDFCPACTAERREQVLSRLRRGQGARYEVELLDRGGSLHTVLVSDAPVRDDEGRLKGATLMVADISERKAAEQRIQHLATHDALTGVPNRAMLTDLLGQAIGQARRYRHRAALLFVDLDRFKEVNDRHGHLVGDRLLVEAVSRMRASIRATDTLARQGGDEFVVLLPEIESPEDAEVVAEKIRGTLELPFVLEGLTLSISSSIGIALFPEHATDEDALMRCADQAMYSAKTQGRNRARYYAD